TTPRLPLPTIPGDRQDRDARVFRPWRKRRRDRRGQSTVCEAWHGGLARRAASVASVTWIGDEARTPQLRHRAVTPPPPHATAKQHPAPPSNRREPGGASE